jgi:hypothetical protein
VREDETAETLHTAQISDERATGHLDVYVRACPLSGDFALAAGLYVRGHLSIGLVTCREAFMVAIASAQK